MGNEKKPSLPIQFYMFDLKAWDENLHIALTGVSNRRTLENFALAGKRVRERPVPPLLIANTLLVPGICTNCKRFLYEP